MTTNNKILLGLSGGVDSTAAALLLQEKGYAVTGLFLDVSGGRGDEAETAAKAAEQLGIPLIYQDISDEFAQKIIQYFCDSYLNGITPNPCVFCNPTVKFKVLSETADRLGIPFLATGHYARVVLEQDDNKYYVYKAYHSRKDQSYMLYRLGQNILSRLLLPIGEIASKSELREYVKGRGILNHEKKDSQEICFIKGMDYSDFLLERGYKDRPGAFVDPEGRTIGTHKGILHYTVGQRKNLGQTFGEPRYVVRIDAESNRVVLGGDKDLFRDVIYADNPSFPIYAEGIGDLPEAYCNRPLQAKIRYAAMPAEVILSKEKEGIKSHFLKPQRAPAPGQSVVFYDGDRLLGGAVIRS